MSDRKASTKTPLLVLGLSRTGGTSLSRALAILGYENLYDLDDIANGGPEHARFWLQALERKQAGKPGFGEAEAETLLSGYDGVRNVPAAAFAAELLQCYASSKVILPTRDIDSWHASCLTTVYQRSIDPVLRLLALVDPGSRVYARVLRGLQHVLYKGDFPGYGKQAFVEHDAFLRETVPPPLLLEYKVQQGWEPLCAFLGKDVPLCDFPRSNDRDSFWRGCRARDRRLAAKAAARLAVRAVLASGLVGLAWWWFRGPVVTFV